MFTLAFQWELYFLLFPFKGRLTQLWKIKAVVTLVTGILKVSCQVDFLIVGLQFSSVSQD